MWATHNSPVRSSQAGSDTRSYSPELALRSVLRTVTMSHPLGHGEAVSRVEKNRWTARWYVHGRGPRGRGQTDLEIVNEEHSMAVVVFLTCRTSM